MKRHKLFFAILALFSLLTISFSNAFAEDFSFSLSSYEVLITDLQNPFNGIISIKDCIYQQLYMVLDKTSGKIIEYNKTQDDIIPVEFGDTVILESFPENSNYQVHLNRMFSSLDGFYKYFSLEPAVFALLEAAKELHGQNNFYYSLSGINAGATSIDSTSDGFIFIEDTINSVSITLNKNKALIFEYISPGRDEYFLSSNIYAYMQALETMEQSIIYLKRVEPDYAKKNYINILLDHIEDLKLYVQAKINAQSLIYMSQSDAFTYMFGLFIDDWRLFSRTFGAAAKNDPIFTAQLFNNFLNREIVPSEDYYSLEFKSWEEKFAAMSYALPRGGITLEEITLLLSAQSELGYIVDTQHAASFFYNWLIADSGQSCADKAIVPFIMCGRAQELFLPLEEKWVEKRIVTQWKVARIFGLEDNSWEQFFKEQNIEEISPANNNTLVFNNDFSELLNNADLSFEKEMLLRNLWDNSYYGNPLKDQFFIKLIKIIHQNDCDMSIPAIEALNFAINLEVFPADKQYDLTLPRSEEEWKDIALSSDNAFTRACALGNIDDEQFLFNFTFSASDQGYMLNDALSNVEFGMILTSLLTENWYSTITDKETRKKYITKLLNFDTNNTKPYIATGRVRGTNYICIDFSLQLWMNGTGIDYLSTTPYPAELLCGLVPPGFSYGIPIRTVDLEYIFVDHAINAIFIGTDENDPSQIQLFNNWVIIEPATDEIPRFMNLDFKGPVYGILPENSYLQIGSALNPMDVFNGDYYLAATFNLNESLGTDLFIRADANEDTIIDTNDINAIYLHLFTEIPSLYPKAYDVDNNQLIEMADVDYLYSYLFLEGPPPPEPFFDSAQTASIQTSRKGKTPGSQTP
ncbi:MAG: hypothetical protein KKD05_02090 [Candidatus Omnitrophica bacterium]|nr:hypothetical protein [Candidatus Omnitrophota bacterium]